MLKRVITVVLSLCLVWGTMVQCTPGGGNNTEGTDSEGTIMDTKPTEPTATWDKELLTSLGLCFTEPYVTTAGQLGYHLRFERYAQMGIKTIRIETVWNSQGKGDWSIDPMTNTILQTAIDEGLRLKLISPTIMSPEAWVLEDPDAWLYSHDGTKAINTLSYWYDGLYEYTEDAINGQLEEYERLGILDHIDALIVDFGPAGEPLYPAAWTQGAGLENPENEATKMWCYGDNAVADFKATMMEKYGSLEAINKAWGMKLASMADFRMPKPGDVKGQQWEDVLTWYLESKREFIDKQIQIFKKAVETHTDGRVQLILYMPGASFTQGEWDECVETGTATFAVRIASENEFLVEMADKYGCLLQFTGLPSIASLKQVRQWMYTNGYGHIPVFGENVASLGASQSPEGLYQTIEDFNLAGIDYTFTNYLWNEDWVTLSDIGTAMEDTVPKIADFIGRADFAQAPYMLVLQDAKPEGDVLAVYTKLNQNFGANTAIWRCRIALPEYEIQEGDVLEYDVMISVPSNGFGFVDGIVTNAPALRSQPFCVDQFGVAADGTGSLAPLAGGQWVHRILGIDVAYNTDNMNRNTTGKVLRDLCLLAQPRKLNGSFAYESVSVYYDNIVITNNGEVKAVIFRSGADLKMDPKTTDQEGMTAAIKVEQFEP